MSYCVLTDVRNYLPLFMLSNWDDGRQTQINAFISHRGAEIDAALKSRGLAVPVTAPAEFVTELLMLNAVGAAGMVLSIMVNAEMPVAFTSLGPGLMQEYQARLMEIREGIGIPEGVAVAAADLAPRGYFTDNGAWNNTSDGSVSDGFGDVITADPTFRGNKIL